jgi:hypothetical protein
MHEYKEAREVYENMEEKMGLDSTQAAMVKMRYKWMPVSGFKGIIESFPVYTLITPTASFYVDNIGIKNYIQG